MKPFGMIPFFIPHVGCPYVCTFCNQSRITGQSGISHLTPDYIKNISICKYNYFFLINFC